jgi:hypothetical protein
VRYLAHRPNPLPCDSSRFPADACAGNWVQFPPSALKKKRSIAEHFWKNFCGRTTRSFAPSSSAAAHPTLFSRRIGREELCALKACHAKLLASVASKV